MLFRSYSEPIYERISPWLKVFERKQPLREQAVEAGGSTVPTVTVLVFGLGRYGRRVLERLHAEGVAVLGVDFDPETIKSLCAAGLPVRFGDGESPEFLDTLPLQDASWVFSSLPVLEAQRALLAGLRAGQFRGRVAVAVREAMPEQALRELGVDRVFQPFEDAADHAGEQLLASLRQGQPGADRKSVV